MLQIAGFFGKLIRKDCYYPGGRNGKLIRNNGYAGYKIWVYYMMAVKEIPDKLSGGQVQD